MTEQHAHEALRVSVLDIAPILCHSPNFWDAAETESPSREAVCVSNGSTLGCTLATAVAEAWPNATAQNHSMFVTWACHT